MLAPHVLLRLCTLALWQWRPMAPAEVGLPGGVQCIIEDLFMHFHVHRQITQKNPKAPQKEWCSTQPKNMLTLVLGSCTRLRLYARLHTSRERAVTIPCPRACRAAGEAYCECRQLIKQTCSIHRLIVSCHFWGLLTRHRPGRQPEQLCELSGEAWAVLCT